MTETERFLITLASGIELFCTRPEAMVEKRSVLKSLADLSSRDMLKFHVAGGRLRVQGKPVGDDLPGVQVLVGQCDMHGIAEVRISRHAAEADLLLLLQSMAAAPSDWVPIPEGGTVRVIDQHSVLAPLEVGAHPLGVVAAKPSPELAAGVTAAVDRLEHDQFPGDLLHQLSRIIAGLTTEFGHHHAAQAVELIHRLMVLEQHAPDGAPRRSYAIAFRRVFTPANLVRIAEAVDDPRCTLAAGKALVRSGLGGAEALVERLENSRDVEACTRYVQILSDMPECAKLLVPLVPAAEWTTACGAVELLGEFSYVQSVDVLASALEHDDMRVRRAAAAALTRIGTHDAVAHVQRALGSEDDGMRSAVAQSVGGRKSGALAMPLLRVAESESTRPEVVRDCYVALGRIGTPVAVQALVEATKPGGRIFGRKAVTERLAALDGLKLVELPVARQRLVELMDDRDPVVRDAASAALHDSRES